MPSADTVDLHTLLDQALSSNRRLSAWVKAGFAVWAITLVGAVLVAAADRAQAASGVLKVRDLQIVDASGKTRVRLAAPLPEPLIMGKTGKRDDSIAGILIYDALGNERGGYVTDNSVGNALLTLDSNTGQEATLVAYAAGGAEFAINDDKKNKVILGAVETGPRLRLMRTGTVIADLPTAGQAPR